MPEPTIIAILGAECTGKSTLAAALAVSLADAAIDAVVVPEYLREFCAAHGRTPRIDEQRHIAREQSRRITHAAGRHAVVVADTTALMTAVYSELLFDDPGLYPESLRAHRTCRLTLLTALDIPWVADGIQRDGPAARVRVDALVRGLLQQQGLPFSVLVGDESARVEAAVRVVRRCLAPARPDAAEPRWQWVCQHCGDGACEALSLGRSR